MPALAAADWVAGLDWAGLFDGTYLLVMLILLAAALFLGWSLWNQPPAD